ncbi:heme-binding domain-containing protein [Bacteroidota bacterium]
MRRIYYYLALFLGVFLIIQLISPEQNLGELDTDDNFLQVSQVPDTLARIFMNSCYDCHSNRTQYPWYGKVAPASWFLNKHVTTGKVHLNFSSWGALDKAQKISKLDGICEECKDGAMPLKSYLLIHKSATLGVNEIRAICEWAEQEAMDIMTGE